MYKAEPLGKEKYLLGEGPYYDLRYNRLSWVDIVNNRLYFMRDKVTESVDVRQHIGAAIPMMDSDGFALALEDGLYAYKNSDISLAINLKNTYKDYWRSNDAKADAKGRIWFGAIVEGDAHEPEGCLYVYDNGQIRCMADDTKIANGMAWNKSRTTFYFSDSAKHTVSAYDYDEKSGDITNRRTLFTLDDGVPDGMTIDSEDNLWVAIWGGSRIEKRSGRTGECLQTIPVLAKQVTSCCFGDEDMMTLYITTAGIGEHGTYDGCLFKCRTDVKGVLPDYCVLP